MSRRCLCDQPMTLSHERQGVEFWYCPESNRDVCDVDMITFVLPS